MVNLLDLDDVDHRHRNIDVHLDDDDDLDDDDELDYDDDIPEDNDKNNEESKPDARNNRSDNPNKTRSRWVRWNQVAINLCCGKMTTMIMMFTKMAL